MLSRSGGLGLSEVGLAWLVAESAENCPVLGSLVLFGSGSVCTLRMGALEVVV